MVFRSLSFFLLHFFFSSFSIHPPMKPNVRSLRSLLLITLVPLVSATPAWNIGKKKKKKINTHTSPPSFFVLIVLYEQWTVSIQTEHNVASLLITLTLVPRFVYMMSLFVLRRFARQHALLVKHTVSMVNADPPVRLIWCRSAHVLANQHWLCPCTAVNNNTQTSLSLSLQTRQNRPWLRVVLPWMSKPCLIGARPVMLPLCGENAQHQTMALWISMNRCFWQCGCTMARWLLSYWCGSLIKPSGKR